MALRCGSALKILAVIIDEQAGAYGGRIAQLRAVKRRCDPDEVLTSAIPLPEPDEV
jgi:hypothetical protein